MEIALDPARELGILKKKYFINYALGVKMNFMNNGFSCNVNANQLFEQAAGEMRRRMMRHVLMECS